MAKVKIDNELYEKVNEFANAMKVGREAMVERAGQACSTEPSDTASARRWFFNRKALLSAPLSSSISRQMWPLLK